MSESCQERFLSVLNEAKTIFANKSKEVQEFKKENETLQENLEQLETEKKNLLSTQESLLHKMKTLEENLDKSDKDLERVTDQLAKYKKFWKNFFTKLLERMTEIEKNGVYNAETFTYLVGDVGRSLWNAPLAGNQKKSPTKKSTANKLSTNKDKKRFRYKDVAPLDLREMARTSRKDDALENTNMFRNQDGDKNIKRRDPLAALGDINTAVNADGAQNKNFLDPDLTLRSPIGPPSRASTPQDACSGEESRMFEDSKLTVDFQQTSPSLIRTKCVEDLRCTLLPRLLSVDGEIRESSEPQSPTIPTRSHSIMKNMDNDVSPEIRNAKRKRSLDVTFGSLLAEPEHLDLKREDLKANVCESAKSVLTEERRELVENCQKNPTIQEQELGENPTLSPEVIVLEDSDFARSTVPTISRKKPKTRSVNETKSDSGSMLLFSPQCNEGSVVPLKVSQVDDESNRKFGNAVIENKQRGDDDKSNFTFDLNLNETTMEESPPERDKEKCKSYKYTEVVRGKDKRAKLNGYFCADCEKYYGSLKLSEQEIQERLQACSRHRARFSPPPCTPDHFWEVDFMNTHEYMEKGFLRSQSELPPEKRKLRSRKMKGKLLKNNKM